ncbi:uncharacterized protein LOC123509140 [Portunus trituberculatus]|uniref:uncharacterized protein LOC123509140 n=1 Tax=Portunus trituberculatus TaxID=210409 RepID=UPI001E1CF5E8|nr:uncharacterized protein LOC123509140 [Portunus trituberculatus]
MSYGAGVMEFFKAGSCGEFKRVLLLYPEAVKVKAQQKAKKKGESLESLDKWIQNDLKTTADSRTPPHVTREELVRLMEWKLARGKFRPRLVELAGSNEEEKVVTVTTEGLRLGAKGKVTEAVEMIATLRGIGPATASAILAVCRPEYFCFFADEVAYTALATTTLKYTAKEYQAVNASVKDCAVRLSKGDKKWTPHEVELAVWTYCVLEKTNPALLHSSSSSSSPESKRRKK